MKIENLINKYSYTYIIEYCEYVLSYILKIQFNNHEKIKYL